MTGVTSNQSNAGWQGEPSRQLRRIFYTKVVSVDVRNDYEALAQIVQAWRDACEADFACLWLLTDLGDRRVFQTAGTAGVPESTQKELLKDFRFEGLSIGHFAFETREVVVTETAREWRKELDGKEYSSVLGGFFEEKLGCPGLVCVPLLSDDDGPKTLSDQSDPGRPPTPRGVVTLHYKDPASSKFMRPDPTFRDAGESDTSLILMGRIAASSIGNIWREQKLIVASELAKLAAQHVSRYTHEPTQVRRDYLKAVLELIQKQVHFQAISLWCREPIEDRLVPVVSTGLRTHEQSRLILDSEYLNHGYTKGEGWTGGVFKTGHSLLKQERSPNDPAPKYIETRFKGKTAEGQTLILPIRASASGADQTVSDPTVVGVLRCRHLAEPRHEDAPMLISAVNIQVLSFLTDQIGPVLLTLESWIKRENMISVVKHDLLAPLAMIRDTVDEIQAGVPGAAIYGPPNLRQCLLRVAQLADELSRSFEERRRLKLRKTSLEADIVAPLKRTMFPFAKETSEMEIRYRHFESIPPVNIDPALIERALYNLLMNAIKYGLRGSVIEISATRPEGGGVAVDVSNQGIGIDERERELIFHAGYRLRIARATRSGSGLGLAIVRQIMRSHDGEATLLRGADPTVFRLWLPKSRVSTERVGNT